MMERGTWLSELDPITSSTDDTLELQAGSAKLLRMPHSREVRALSQERRRSINSRTKARNSFILVRPWAIRSEAHTSELQSLKRTSYARFCLKKKTTY